MLTTICSRRPGDVAVQAAMSSHTRGVQFVGDRIQSSSGGRGRGGQLAPGATDAAARRDDLQRAVLLLSRRLAAAPTPGAAGFTVAFRFVADRRAPGLRRQSVDARRHGTVDGTAYPQVMVAMGGNRDQWLPTSRRSYGTRLAMRRVLSTADVARVRSLTAGGGHGPPRVAASALPLAATGWKVTASIRQVALQRAAGGFHDYAAIVRPIRAGTRA
jgi:hypothetical protein